MTARLFAASIAAVAVLAPAQVTIEQHIERAHQAAGTRWAEAADYFCAANSMPNRPTDPAIEPTRLFDNLSVLGSVGTAMYVVHSSDGLILIDAGYPEQTESVLLPGLRALGLDPKQVRALIVLHGHSDHFGAARFFQDEFGTKVYLAAPDWDLLEAPQAKGKGAAPPVPKRDQIVVDRQPIVLGDTSILPVLVPGHTKGALALIFPVFDHGQKHVAGLFGGTVLSAGFVSADGLREYVKSLSTYATIAAEQHVDVEIQNHPLMDGFAQRLQLLRTRDAQSPHPFVIGEPAYAAFLNVMSECSQAQLLRKGN